MIKYVCDNCGRDFQNVRKLPRGNETHVFCSQKCYHAFNVNYHKCKICGELFIKKGHSNWSSGVCCSKECSKINKNKKEEDTHIDKICIYCGKTFRVKKCIQNRFITCSQECRDRHPKSEIKKCKYCGKEFRTSFSDKKRGNTRSQ